MVNITDFQKTNRQKSQTVKKHNHLNYYLKCLKIAKNELGGEV
jgi:hypothetical protein